MSSAIRPVALPDPSWTHTDPSVVTAHAILARCRLAWLTAWAAWSASAVLLVAGAVLWRIGPSEVQSAGVFVFGVLSAVSVFGGVHCLDSAGLTDGEQARLAVSDIPPIEKAVLAMGMERGVWAFQRVLPVVRQNLANRQPGARALGMFKIPRSSRSS